MGLFYKFTATAAVLSLGMSAAVAQVPPPPYDVVAGTGAVGADAGSFSGSTGTISALNLNWAVTAAAPTGLPGATTSYHVYNGVQTWSFTRNGAPAVVDLAFAIGGVDAWLNAGTPPAPVTEAIGLPVGTVCDISNPAYVFPAGAVDGTPGGPVFSFTPNNGSGLAVLQYLGNQGAGPANRYGQYAPVPCTYTGSSLVLTGSGFAANEAGGTGFWHGLAYLRVLNTPAVSVPTLDLLGLGALAAMLGGAGLLMGRRKRIR